MKKFETPKARLILANIILTESQIPISTSANPGTDQAPMRGAAAGVANSVTDFD